MSAHNNRHKTKTATPRSRLVKSHFKTFTRAMTHRLAIDCFVVYFGGTVSFLQTDLSAPPTMRQFKQSPVKNIPLRKRSASETERGVYIAVRSRRKAPAIPFAS